jgi:hypothetical protein
LGLAFDEAVSIVDLVTVLGPSEREMPEAATVIAEGRATLRRLGAAPFLERLDAGPSNVIDGRPPREADEPTRTTTSSQTG